MRVCVRGGEGGRRLLIPAMPLSFEYCAFSKPTMESILPPPKGTVRSREGGTRKAI